MGSWEQGLGAAGYVCEEGLGVGTERSCRAAGERAGSWEHLQPEDVQKVHVYSGKQFSYTCMLTQHFLRQCCVYGQCCAHAQLHHLGRRHFCQAFLYLFAMQCKYGWKFSCSACSACSFHRIERTPCLFTQFSVSV